MAAAANGVRRKLYQLIRAEVINEQRNKPLTDEDKAFIIEQVAKIGKRWTTIAKLLGNRAESTVRSFYNSYLAHGFKPKKPGPPIKINQEKIEEVVNLNLSDCTLSLDELAERSQISASSVSRILHDNNIKYVSLIKRAALTIRHKDERIKFCKAVVETPNFEPLFFSDEATVKLNSANGGVWRICHYHPDQCFINVNQHEISQMIWGAIGPNGYKSELIIINGIITADNYCRMLQHYRVFEELRLNFPQVQIRFMQDNAPPHAAKSTKECLQDMGIDVIEWPAKSPDLNPIEQVWAYMKKELKKLAIHNAQELKDALLQIWDGITPDQIKKYYTSFYARCAVCLMQNGENLNGHWNDVHKLHHLYSTAGNQPNFSFSFSYNNAIIQENVNLPPLWV